MPFRIAYTGTRAAAALTQPTASGALDFARGVVERGYRIIRITDTATGRAYDLRELEHLAARSPD